MGRWTSRRACVTVALAVAVLVTGGLLPDGAGAARAGARADVRADLRADVRADVGAHRVGLAVRPAKVARLRVGHARTTGNRARLRISWRASRRATSYQISYDGARNMRGATSRRTRKPRLTLRHLKNSQRYCIRVRAVRGRGARAKHGAWSRVVCRRTPHEVGRTRPAWVVGQRIENTSAGPRASLTLRWPRTRGASAYEVHAAPGYDVQRSRARAVRRGYRVTGRAQETHVVRGLAPGRRYCFQVRGRFRHGVGPLSPSHCKITMPAAKAVKPTALAVKMATYNVCGAARHCRKRWSWAARRPLVVQQIRATGADVVHLQETRRVLSQLVGDLAPHGFVKACSFAGAQAVLVRSSVYRVVPHAASGLRFRGDRSHGGCWTRLHHRRTGAPVVVASVHLMKGRGHRYSRARAAQVAQVVSLMQRAHGTIGAPSTPPFLIAGDFNSHRGHVSDGPRKRLARAGFLEAYDISATYESPRRNSANQFRRKPLTSTIWGSHVDRVFVPRGATVTGWRTVARVRGGRYVAPMPSDHNPVAVTVYLPVPPDAGRPRNPGGGCLLGILFC